MPCFFKTISTFAFGQREILSFLESLFNLSREHHSKLCANHLPPSPGKNHV
ncbi:MAG: hypothetical protein Q7T20_13400 [Saprospiraceae bacterium]|nr:hypothetical protein [Saprospiraceae bacterium]